MMLQICSAVMVSGRPERGASARRESFAGGGSTAEGCGAGFSVVGVPGGLRVYRLIHLRAVLVDYSLPDFQ